MPEPGGNAEIVAHGGQDDVYGIAPAAFEMAAANVSAGFDAFDHGLDCRAMPQFEFDEAEDAAKPRSCAAD